jgi:D-sedoheptulose 7-phosphate isomerase
MNMKKTIKNAFIEHLEVFNISMSTLISSIEDAANLCIESINNGGKILLLGNGGSAADAQHIAAELVGRYKVDRKAIPAIAITTDSSILTSISNDYGYSQVFSRQIEALANNIDVVIGISTSGNSKNVINALKAANKIGCKTISLSGSNKGQLAELCNINIIAPSEDTARIQEIHIFIGHTICHLIEEKINN